MLSTKTTTRGTGTVLTLLAAAALGLLAACGREPMAPTLSEGATLVTSAATGGNKPGNSLNAHDCQNYQTLFTRDGQPFTSASACVAYAAKKGAQLINGDAVTCLNGGWQSLGSSTGLFTSEQECVNYAVGTGTPVVYADVSIATDPGTLGCGLPWNPDYCTSIHIRVYNAGPVAVTVSWALTGTYQTTTAALAQHITAPNNANGICTSSDDGQGTWSASCIGARVPPGGSTFIAHVIARDGATQAGTASVTASSLPDPNSANNTFSWNFTAPSP